MVNIDTLTVLYLTGLTGLGQSLAYFFLLGKAKVHEQRSWIAYQAVSGLGFLLLALGAGAETPTFYVMSSLFLLTAYLSRFAAVASVFQILLNRRHFMMGAGVIVFMGILFTWCHLLGAPLGSLETIVLLPLGVASGLTAKYQRDHQVNGQSKPMDLIAYFLWLECIVFGALALGALAGIGQDYVNPSASLSTVVALLLFVIQIVLHILWVIHSANEQKAIFGGNTSVQRNLRAASNSNGAKLSKPLRESKKLSGDGLSTLVNDGAESHLTAKELEVLQLVVAGKKNKEIASELQISEASVKVHKSRMTSKLGVKTIPELSIALQGLDSRVGGNDVQEISVAPLDNDQEMNKG